MKRAGFPRRPSGRPPQTKIQNLKSKIGGRRFRPHFDLVEDRRLLSTFLVNAATDTGPGSLRQAILESNAATGLANTIDFDIPGQGVQTIAPLSSLPAITQAVLIDGWSRSGYAGTPLIELSGSQLSTGAGDGLTITGSGVTVRGLDINNFSQGAGILISGTGATGNVIAANDIGTDPTGAQVLPNYFGVRILGGAHDNLVGGSTAASGNLITDNLGPGVAVEGDGSVGNRITADRIFANDISSTPTPGGTLQFDGSSYVRLPGELGPDGSQTFEAWIQTTSGGVILAFQNTDPSSNPTYGAPLLYVGSDGKLYGSITPTSAISSSATVNDGRWHFVSLVHSLSAGSLTLYLDGRIVASGSYNVIPDELFDQIGTGYTFPSDPSTPGGWYGFHGQITDVAIWSMARSTDQIGQDMTTALTGDEPGLDAYYPFNRTQGLTEHDLSANHNDAILAGVNGHLPSWSSSAGLAIDLGGDGVTYNASSPRQGPNNFQNFPIVVATADGGLQGWLGGSSPNTTFRVDVFASATYAPGGAAEAQDNLGSLQVTTDSQGQAVFDVPFAPPAGLPLVSATATDPQGNTSEVSAVRTAIVATPTQTVRAVPGQPLIFSAGSGDAIAIHDPDAGPLDSAWELTLSVTSGFLTLFTTAGLTGSGNGTGTLHYEGSLSALNAALAGLSFTQPPGFYGNTSLSLDARSAGAVPLQAAFLISVGRFLVTTTADGGAGSLRQAILDSNAATGGTNTIDFDIPGQGVLTIAPTSPLPSITNPVLIDGTSQPGYAGTPLIAIDASSSGMADGLSITGCALTVRGLTNGGFALGAENLPDELTLQSGPLQANDGSIAGRVDTYRIDTTSDGRLVAQFDPLGITARLALLDVQGQVLVESDGVSPANPAGQIDEHLAAGTYFLEVVTTGSTGELGLSAAFTSASAPFQAVPVRSSNYLGYDPVAVGDFNGDGIPDLVAIDGVHLGLGDGTFRQPTAGLGLGAANPALNGIVAADFTGDGKLDLAVAISGSNDIAVLLGNGDGTFQAPGFYAVGTGTWWPPGAGTPLVAGDFTGDGHLDLAVANPGSDDVSVLFGNGDGTFQPAVQYPVGRFPNAVVAGDFTGDGHLDLAVACYGNENLTLGQGPAGTDPGGVYLLLGNGNGTFQPAKEYAAAQGPCSLVAGDFRGDGKLDLAVGSSNAFIGGGEISVLLGNGDGTFQAPQTVFTGYGASALVAGDFRGDGKLDLAVADGGDDTVSVLLGNGDGTFQAPQTHAPAVFPFYLVAGDFTGNGRQDLATADYTDQIAVLLNNGDGTFAVNQQLTVGASPFSLAAGDFTGDGKLDLATANFGSNDVSVLLGNGDGTFQPQQRFAAGGYPSDLVAGDFNGDGRLDLAVSGADASTFAGEVFALLGNGDGTFQPAVDYVVGFFPWAIVAGDFVGNDHLDLAVCGNDPSTGAGEVAVLLGNGDGTFQPARLYAAGDWNPECLAVGDFTGNGRLDLAVLGNADQSSLAGEVSVLLGNGDGTFQPAVQFPVGLYEGQRGAIVAGDFIGNGRTDLAVADLNPASYALRVDVLLSQRDGTFQPAGHYDVVENFVNGIVAGDFTGNGHMDLALEGSDPETGAPDWSVLLGNGDGTFRPAQTVALGFGTGGPVTAGDFTGDGRTDLAVADQNVNTVSLLLNNGDATFTAPGQFVTTPHATPLVADFNGDGTNDALVVDGHGNVLYRQGIPGKPGTFEPPVTVNPNTPSRDIVWVPNSCQGPLIASVDAHDNHVSLHAYRSGGFVQVGSLNTGRLPAQIIAADLDHSGWKDLIVRNAGDGTLSVFFNDGSGSFQTAVGPSGPFLSPLTIPVRIGVSDVQAVDTTGAGTYDLVVTNKLSGQVSVVRNLGARTFAPPVPYRAGTGLSEIDPSSTPEVTSLEATAGIAAGPLTPGNTASLVTINPGSHSMDVLAGLGGGQFDNPAPLANPGSAEVVRMADFTGNGIDDLAVLTSTGLSIYLGDGKGGFLLPKTYAVPPEADGLTVADLLGNGKLDLLVGDAYGDVLVLLGNGDGTFQPYHEANQTIELAVADLTGKGAKDIIYADQGLDRVVVDYGAGNSTVLGSQSTGLLAPGAVTLADLNGDGIPDLIVANSGSNNVLIYPGLGNGQFGPAVNGGHGFFTGTNPVGITVANLTGNLPDLVVADKGSNDVSILLNQGNFSFTQGPRLKSGGSGPVSTVVGHFTASPYPDILVTNSGSNDVALLPGVGGGFFNDTNPQTFPVGNNPGPLFVGNFDGKPDLLTVNAGSNDLTLISNFMSADATTSTIASGGTDPATAFSFSGSSGFDDLVVGNGGDGVLALFEGSAAGLTLTSSETNPALPSPSALAFSAMTGGQVQFYAATAGREAAELVALSLGVETGTSSQLTTPGPLNTVAQLVPASESSLPLVATVLTLTIEVNGLEMNVGPSLSELAGSSGFLPGTGISIGQGLMLPGRSGGAGADGMDALGLQQLDEASANSGPAARGVSAWERTVLGLDEAWDELRGRINLDGNGSAAPSGGPGATLTPPSPPSQGGEFLSPSEGAASNAPAAQSTPPLAEGGPGGVGASPMFQAGWN
jgi:hypothetical protein